MSSTSKSENFGNVVVESLSQKTPTIVSKYTPWKIIEKNNARLSSSVSNNTDFLILGDNPGSKFEKAKQLNIKIINEKEFLTMLENL